MPDFVVFQLQTTTEAVCDLKKSVDLNFAQKCASLRVHFHNVTLNITHSHGIPNIRQEQTLERICGLYAGISSSPSHVLITRSVTVLAEPCFPLFVASISLLS